MVIYALTNIENMASVLPQQILRQVGWAQYAPPSNWARVVVRTYENRVVIFYTPNAYDVCTAIADVAELTVNGVGFNPVDWY